MSKLCLKAMTLSYLGKQDSWVNDEKCKTEIPTKNESASKSIKHIQIPLILVWASTVPNTQGLSLEEHLFNFDPRKELSFG